MKKYINGPEETLKLLHELAKQIVSGEVKGVSVTSVGEDTYASIISCTPKFQMPLLGAITVAQQTLSKELLNQANGGESIQEIKVTW